MKVFLILVVLTTVLSSCEKFCTCTNPNNSGYSEIEISPEEECSDYSNSTIGNCE